jgi:hypothetical protein
MIKENAPRKKKRKINYVLFLGFFGVTSLTFEIKNLFIMLETK